MQFCTINEAWGNKEQITNQYKNSQSENKNNKMETNMDDSTDSSIVETFIEQKRKKRKEKQKYYTATEDSYYETYTDTINDSREREKLISKVLKSRRCRDVLRKKFRPNLINKLILLFDDYRDVLVLMLVGFCFIIFLSMLWNLNKK